MTLLAPSQCALAIAPSAAIRNRHWSPRDGLSVTATSQRDYSGPLIGSLHPYTLPLLIGRVTRFAIFPIALIKSYPVI
ncbi:hypothetical protein OUZ56_003140 [Daphnia magna]|uniref:Uncharacterized protein n=1 Tax=Daphnia magna TaxID=35525 RepID=A0ABR0A7V4_9CRUS|nr:hypothetical protein OUZ56_003140 [Daphnia magna]